MMQRILRYALALGAGFLLLAGCSSQQRVVAPVFTEHETGLRYLIQERGRGELIQKNDVVFVHYTLMLEDSTIVDNSYDRGEPVSFMAGSGQVIKGWDEGIMLFRQGDKATLIVPPHLAYGDRAMGAIPPGSTLYFNIEIVKVNRAPQPFAVPEGINIVQTTSGLRYAVIEPGDGTMLIPNMRVRIHYTGYFEDMSIFDSSFQREEPIDFTLGKGMVIRGWEEGISKLRVGDKARLWIPYHLAYGEQGRGPIPPASNLIFDVQVIDAEEVKRPRPYPVDGLELQQTESGLQYFIVQEGQGDLPQTGQMVTVHYTGFLINGNIFDSSVERGTPFRFLLGRGQVIAGWDEGIALMQKGAKYRFIIPPELAYGQRATGPIPANATLIFDVELIDFD